MPLPCSNHHQFQKAGMNSRPGGSKVSPYSAWIKKKKRENTFVTLLKTLATLNRRKLSNFFPCWSDLHLPLPSIPNVRCGHYSDHRRDQYEPPGETGRQG